MVEWSVVDSVLQSLGEICQLSHVASFDKFPMCLTYLVLDLVPLPALTLVDFECLVEVVGSAMLLGQEFHRLFDEGEINPGTASSRSTRTDFKMTSC